MSAGHPSRRISIKLSRDSRLLFSGAGRLFLIFQIQNSNNQKTDCQYNHKFFICTHNNHPFPQGSERVRARPPAARVSILYCHGAHNVSYAKVSNKIRFMSYSLRSTELNLLAATQSILSDIPYNYKSVPVYILHNLPAYHR